MLIHQNLIFLFKKTINHIYSHFFNYLIRSFIHKLHYITSNFINIFDHNLSQSINQSQKKKKNTNAQSSHKDTWPILSSSHWSCPKRNYYLIQKATSPHQMPCGGASPDHYYCYYYYHYSLIRKHSKSSPTYPNSHCTNSKAVPGHLSRRLCGPPPRRGTSPDRRGP